MFLKCPKITFLVMHHYQNQYIYEQLMKVDFGKSCLNENLIDLVYFFSQEN